MAIPDLTYIVEEARRNFPIEWASAHTGGSGTEDFIRIVTKMMHAVNPGFGLNGKRGNPRDISDDAINFIGEGPGTTPGGQPCTVIDIIGGAGGPNPQPQWGVMTDPVAASGAWVNPNSAPGFPHQPPPPPPPLYPPYPGDAPFDAVGVALFADYALAGNPPDPQMGRWYGRTIYDWLAKHEPTLDASIAKHRKEWRALLGLPPL